MTNTAVAVAARQRAARERPGARDLKTTSLGWALLLPAIGIFVVFVFYPLARVFWLSTQGTNIFGQPAGSVGLQNFITVFTDPQFAQTMWQTAVFCIGVVAGRLITGLLIAVPLTAKVKGIPVFRALLTSPLAASTAAGSVAFAAILAPGTGIANSIITEFGGQPVPWLTSPSLALFCVVMVTVWCSLGFTVMLMVGALGAIDEEVIEAARVDGAGTIRTFGSVTLPLMTPTLFFIVVTGTVEGLTTFGQIKILTQGGPANSTTTLVYSIYTTAFGSGGANFGIASALGIVLFLIVLVLTYIQFGVLEKRVNY